MRTSRVATWPASGVIPWNTTEIPKAPDIETSSDAYARRFHGAVGAWLLRVQEQAVLRMLGPVPRATVLEVGGGHGQLTSALIRQGHRVTVVGSSQRCQQRIKPLVDAGACRFMTGDLLRLPYPDQSFDAVVSVRLLAHVEAWRQLTAELTRVARWAVIVDYPTVRSTNCLAPLLFPVKQWLEHGTRPYRVFRDSTLVEAFGASRFVRRVRTPTLFFPLALHRALGRTQVSDRLEQSCRTLMLTQTLGSPVIAMFTRTRAEPS